MNLYAVIFYILAILILSATAMAITRHNPVHAIIYLILSFLGSAFLFYLMGSPFLAGLEVIIYAGAIMVLFLMVVMILGVKNAEDDRFTLGQWGPAISMGLLLLAVAVLLVMNDSGSRIGLAMATVSPRDFGRYVFQRYWLAIEIISFLLLVALVAALHIGRGKKMMQEEKEQ